MAATILLIEDNELNQKLFRQILEMNGFLVLSAVNAETGIELAAKERPDLILMDIQLPGMNGLEATRSLKADEELRELPVLALSGFASDQDRQDALDAGCIGFIVKPISTRTFVQTLQSCLDDQPLS